MPLFSFVIATLLSATTSEAHYYEFGVLKTSSWTTKSGRPTGAFQHVVSSASPSTSSRSSTRSRTFILQQQTRIATLLTLQNNSSGSSEDNNLDDTKSSFLSTNKASVSFKNNKGSNNNNSKNSPANISTIDSILLNLTSDRTSLLLGMVGIAILLLNRIISFPEDATFEASRSRIDLLGVFAAGSVLLNGITKLDVESVTAEQVALEGVNEGRVVWYNDDFEYDGNKASVEWTLSSLIKCSPARTAVMLGKHQKESERWVPLAMTGILPSDTSLRTSLRTDSTPILDRMLRDDGSIKGGTVGGTEVIGSQKKMKGPNESYLPTLQALPGKIEFSYLPSNAQEALLLPVPPSSSTDEVDGCRYAIVLGGDTAKSFAPRDISWCKEIASWLSSEK